jgi:hypothetical protein
MRCISHQQLTFHFAEGADAQRLAEPVAGEEDGDIHANLTGGPELRVNYFITFKP